MSATRVHMQVTTNELTSSCMSSGPISHDMFVSMQQVKARDYGEGSNKRASKL